MKKVYFATPVNGRREEGKREKKFAALTRCVTVREKIRRRHPEMAVTFSFNVCPFDEELTEPEAMGRCVTLLMKCDMLVYDDGWNESRGMQSEMAIADYYGIPKMPLRFLIDEGV